MTQRLVREGSLAFSLAELSRLEDERQALERQRDERLAAERLEADRDARQRLLAGEEEEARLRDAAKREEEARAREEKARLSAIEHAEVLRAKTLAEAEASARFAAEEHRHAEALASIRAVEDLRKWKRHAMLSWGLCGIVVVAGAGLEFGMVRPESSRRVAAVEAARDAMTFELRGVRSRLEEERQAADDSRGRLAEQTRRADALAKSLEAAQAALPPTKTPAPAGHMSGVSHPSVTHMGAFSNDCLGSRDPLCGLPH
jgi:hypothetical protein